MGKAIDTVLAYATEGAASAFPTALAATTGDSLTIRSTNGNTNAKLMALIYSAGGNEQVRVISPLLHDNVTGLTFQPAEHPAITLLPVDTAVQMYAQDTLQVQGGIAAAGTIVAGLVIAYDDLRGVDADLFQWSDIRDDIRYIKPVQVALNAVAVGAWTDTPITTTENQLHADRSYAVLGYNVDPQVDIVGIKGSATGNLRICGPGANSTIDISDYYIHMSEKHQRPYIPVFDSNDRNSVYVSAANNAALAGAANSVYMILAELKTRR